MKYYNILQISLGAVGWTGHFYTCDWASCLATASDAGLIRNGVRWPLHYFLIFLILMNIIHRIFESIAISQPIFHYFYFHNCIDELATFSSRIRLMTFQRALVNLFLKFLLLLLLIISWALNFSHFLFLSHLRKKVAIGQVLSLLSEFLCTYSIFCFNLIHLEVEFCELINYV